MQVVPVARVSVRCSRFDGTVREFTHHLEHTEITYTFNDDEIKNLTENKDKIESRIQLRK